MTGGVTISGESQYTTTGTKIGTTNNKDSNWGERFALWTIITKIEARSIFLNILKTASITFTGTARQFSVQSIKLRYFVKSTFFCLFWSRDQSRRKSKQNGVCIRICRTWPGAEFLLGKKRWQVTIISQFKFKKVIKFTLHQLSL